MAHEVRAVVAKAKQQPVTIETISVPDPGPGEALVKVQACGVCHTDLHYREGGINDDFPVPPRPRGRGRRRIGRRRRHEREPRRLRRPRAGGRRAAPVARAAKGRPWYCFDSANATQKMTLDGVDALARARHRRVRREDARRGGAVRPIDPSARPEAAGLLGCGVMAGLGAAMYTGNVQRGDTRRRVRVWRRGRRGDRRVRALAGARTIIAVDLDPRKLEWAKAFGATHTVNSRRGRSRSRRSRRSPAATAPTCASRRSATPR